MRGLRFPAELGSGLDGSPDGFGGVLPRPERGSRRPYLLGGAEEALDLIGGRRPGTPAFGTSVVRLADGDHRLAEPREVGNVVGHIAVGLAVEPVGHGRHRVVGRDHRLVGVVDLALGRGAGYHCHQGVRRSDYGSQPLPVGGRPLSGEVGALRRRLDVGGEPVDAVAGRRGVGDRRHRAGDIGVDVVEVGEVPAVHPDPGGVGLGEELVHVGLGVEALARRPGADVDMGETRLFGPGHQGVDVAAFDLLWNVEPHALAQGQRPAVTGHDDAGFGDAAGDGRTADPAEPHAPDRLPGDGSDGVVGRRCRWGVGRHRDPLEPPLGPFARPPTLRPPVMPALVLVAVVVRALPAEGGQDRHRGVDPQHRGHAGALQGGDRCPGELGQGDQPEGRHGRGGEHHPGCRPGSVHPRQRADQRRGLVGQLHRRGGRRPGCRQARPNW